VVADVVAVGVVDGLEAVRVQQDQTHGFGGGQGMIEG
jgi:hypothetical protein